jgi:hypothetical protein
MLTVLRSINCNPDAFVRAGRQQPALFVLKRTRSAVILLAGRAAAGCLPLNGKSTT